MDNIKYCLDFGIIASLKKWVYDNLYEVSVSPQMLEENNYSSQLILSKFETFRQLLMKTIALLLF